MTRSNFINVLGTSFDGIPLHSIHVSHLTASIIYISDSVLIFIIGVNWVYYGLKASMTVKNPRYSLTCLLSLPT
jgi:hypothetical protein